MRRMRLQGQNERLLREAVQGMLSESGVIDMLGSAASWAAADPPVLNTLGRVFYPTGGFNTSVPFLVVARKSTARSDETASAYLLMFEKPPWGVAEQIGRLWYPPSVVLSSDVNDIKDILSGLKPVWEVTPELKRSVVLLRAQNNPSQFMLVQEIPAGNEAFLRYAAGLGRREIDPLEREAYKRSGKSGHQKIWRFFGEPARHTWADAFITLASAAADFGGAAAEVAEPLQGIGAIAREPRLVAVLELIKKGDKLFSLASIALAGTIAADSKIDYDRVKASKNLSLNPNIDAAIEFYKNRTVMDAVNYALSMLAAAAELFAPSGTGASAAEISLLVMKAGITAFNAKGVYESANEFFKNNIAPKLKEVKNVLIRAFDAINASPEFSTMKQVLKDAVSMGREFVTQL